MYARTIQNPTTNTEQVLTFGVSGKLVMNVMVMFDRETDTLWSQLLGEAIEGVYPGFDCSAFGRRVHTENFSAMALKQKMRPPSSNGILLSGKSKTQKGYTPETVVTGQFNRKVVASIG